MGSNSAIVDLLLETCQCAKFSLAVLSNRLLGYPHRILNQQQHHNACTDNSASLSILETAMEDLCSNPFSLLCFPLFCTLGDEKTITFECEVSQTWSSVHLCILVLSKVYIRDIPHSPPLS